MPESRRKLIAGNWKLNLDSKQGEAVANEIAKAVTPDGAEVVLFPTYLTAAHIAKSVFGKNVAVGVQDVFFGNWGAYTGAISPAAALAEGLQWTIVGHSERRTIFGEDDALIAKKAKAALDAGMKVIFCVGESHEARIAGKTEAVLNTQFFDGVLKATDSFPPSFCIAYEPVWAIGTGMTATPEMAQQAHLFLRSLISHAAGKEAAERTRILYGGSVNAKNATGLLTMPDIDGALVGGASLKADEFTRIIRFKE